MKRIIPITGIILAAAFSSCEEKKTAGNALLYGQFTSTSGDTVFLYDVSTSNFRVLDSTITDADGAFEFSPLISYKGFYKVEVGRNSQQFATVILEPGDSVKLAGDAKNLGYTWKSTGSKDAERFNEFNEYITLHGKKREPYVNRLDSIQKTFQVLVSMLAATDSQKVDSLDKIFSDIFTRTNEKLYSVDSHAVLFVRDFIDREPASFANIPALRLLEPFENFPYYEKTVNGLEANYKEAPNVKLLREMVERERPFCKGQVPPDIMLHDPKGNVRKLSSLKGKVVLVDFWATWCQPCIRELPNIRRNYDQYKNLGFEVYSVSLDRTKPEWVEGIRKYHLDWPNHVLDVQGPGSFAMRYRVRTIPRTFLLSRDGTLLEKDIHGEELNRRLEEIFKPAP